MSYYESEHDYDREGIADTWGDELDERYLIDRAEHEAHAGDGGEPDDEMAAALLRECPACGAPAGELCGNIASEKRPIPDMVDDVHKARLEDPAPTAAPGEPIESVEPDLDEQALTAAHLAVEDELVELRNAGFGVVGPRNGFVIYHRDGTYSGVMRMGTRDGLRIAITAYLKAIQP